MKKHRYQITALILSLIMITGSLSGSVFAAETSESTEESTAVESSEMSEDIEATEESEASNEDFGQSSVIATEEETEEETEESTEETTQKIEETAEENQNADESEETQDQFEQEDSLDHSEEEENSADASDTSIEDGNNTETTAEEKIEDSDSEEAVITAPAEQESVSTDSMNAELSTDEEVVASGSCGENVTWKLTGIDNDLTLTISGSGNMDHFSEGNIPWASKRAEIKHLIVEDGITSIGNYNFYSLNKLKEVSLPDSIAYIGQYGFCNCTSLLTISVPERLKSISTHAFSNCSSLTSMIIPDGVLTIGYDAFVGCSSLTSVTIPDSVTIIKSSAFSACRSLTSVRIPGGVTSIESSVFMNCSSLTNVTIPDSVMSIGDNAFYGCSSLTNVTIPDSVTRIENHVFKGCSNLTSVTIPDGVTYIGSSTFYDCSSLTSVTIPDSVTGIGYNAFYGCSSLTSVTIPDSVTGIGYNAFYGCSSLTNVTIPDSVMSIGDNAFYGCSSLTNVTIPDSVTSIERNTFSGCSSLTSVTIPNSVTSIGEYAFRGCSSLTSVTIPDSVTSIGGFSFYDCSSLTSVTIPDSVTSIGEYAFYGCSSLTNVTIPDSVTSIERNTFSGCSSLTNVTIPDSVMSIGDNAFYGCSSLTNVTIPDSVTSIERNTFSGCGSLTSVTIPDSVTSIGEYAFSGCGNLTNVIIPGSVTSIGSSAFNNYRLTIYFRGTEVQWESAVGDRNIKYSSIFFNYFSADASYELSSTSFFFTGKEIKPLVTVTLNEKLLVEGTDYELLYENNINAGTATVTISGKGNFSGSFPSAEFIIKPASIKSAEISGIEDKIYNGGAQIQTPVVKLGSTTLTEGTDYTVSYKNNTNAGTATVAIIGKGNYTGTAPAKKFTINPASIESAEISGIEDKIYNGGAQIQTPVVKLGSTTLIEGTDYIVSYSNNTNVGTATVTIIGKGNYTDTALEKQFTILPKSISQAVVGDIPEQTYTGNELKPNVTVTLDGKSLTSETDYTVYYSNNTDVGTATITITGKGCYNGTKTVEFIVVPAPVTNASVTGIVNKTYNGAAQTQAPVVKLGSTTLKVGTDYTVSYSNNKNAGTATVTITGKGNYIGTMIETFTIKKAVPKITLTANKYVVGVGEKISVMGGGHKESVEYTYSSSDPSICNLYSVFNDGKAKKPGVVTITVNTEETSNYTSGSKSVVIYVVINKKPGNCHFTKWNNSKYTGCRISWNKVAGAEGYQTLLSWTNGTHASSTIVKSSVLYRNCTVHPQHVSQMKVRAFYTLNGQRKYGPWSNVEYITPSPAKLTTKNASSGSNLKMNISWNIIYGCNGYNVFITTNPNGKWYWNQSTTEKATATSASIDKCGGAKLKKNTRYYVRIVTRRKRNGVFCTVPMPANNTYIGSFVIK